MDFTNWQKEREKLMNEIFIKIREREDRQGHTSYLGKVVIDLLKISEVEKEYKFGPYYFPRPFTGTPTLSLTSVRPEGTHPFWILIDVAGWTQERGAVDGFYIGVYPLVLPDPSVSQHIITWQAQGKASKISRNSMLQSWGDYWDNRTQNFRIGGLGT